MTCSYCERLDKLYLRVFDRAYTDYLWNGFGPRIIRSKKYAQWVRQFIQRAFLHFEQCHKTPRKPNK